ncbi:MAG: A24 family peptidase [Planctomycetia bacterium]|nr:A24 family peptidase [Planctomycetia bacterium]
MSGWMLLLVAGLGLIAGAIANHCAERWSEAPRGINPWLKSRAGSTPSSIGGKLPVLGWWLRRQELSAIAAGVWIRPLVVEVLTGALFVLLAWLPQDHSNFLAPLVRWGNEVAERGPWPVGTWLFPVNTTWHWAQFLAQALLVTLMLIASLIDFDEKLIPDQITMPGTLLGLILAVAWPRTLPVGIATTVNGRAETAMLNLATPNDWPRWLEGAPHALSLALALSCFAAWCAALLPWYFRRGRAWRKSLALTWSGMRRGGSPWAWLGFMAFHMALIGSIWSSGGEHWQALVSSLAGVVAGGGLIWTTRIVSGRVLEREALGFGDVTLMAMIGAYIGWQACVLVFFIAPLFALVVALIQWLLRRETEIYYGPFLALATLWVVLRWPQWWDWAGPLFGIPWLVPCALMTCLALLFVLLYAVRIIKETVLGWLGGGAE